nr:G patch domain-containing protein 4 [Ipomoea batatas]
MQVYTQRQRILQGMKKQLLKSLVHNEVYYSLFSKYKKRERGKLVHSYSSHDLEGILVKKTKSAPANDVLDVAKVVEASEIQIVPDAEGRNTSTP